MKLKHTVTDLAEVDERFHGLYEGQDDGTYKLGIDLGDHESDLRNNRDRLLDEKKNISKENHELKLRLSQLESKEHEREQESLIAKQDFEGALNLRQQKYETEVQELQQQLAQYKDHIKSEMLHREVNQIASKLFGEDADIFESKVAERVTVTGDNVSNFKVQVLDINGNPSDMTPDHLITEFKGNDRLQRYIKGRDSSGGDASGTTGSVNSEVGSGEWDNVFNPDSRDTYSPMRQQDLKKQNPELYKQLFDKYKLGDPLALLTN